jgi:dihydropteroate synthase
MAALERGARILRVHDVPEAVQVIDIWKAIKYSNNIDVDPAMSSRQSKATRDL